MIHAAGLARMALQFVRADARICFAVAILVNSSLTFDNASAVSFPVGMAPFSAMASCCAAATT